MKSRMIILGVVILLVLTGVCCAADLFFWESKKGVNVTDDPAKLPIKFKEKYEQFKRQQPKEVAQQVKVIPESAKNAIRALKKLEARCQSGISYRDFSPAVGEANFEANMFLQNKDSSNFNNIKSSIIDTLLHYEYANIIWKHMFNSGHKLHTDYKLNSKFVIDFFKRYPDSNKPVSEGGIIYHSDYLNEDVVIFQDALRYVFNKASIELKKGFEMVYN